MLQRDSTHHIRVGSHSFISTVSVIQAGLPNSPNMNPIELMWYVLKAALYKRFTDISTIWGGFEKV